MNHIVINEQVPMAGPLFDGKTKAIWTERALFTHTLDRLR